MSSGLRVLPSISETIGGTEEERTTIIALESLDIIHTEYPKYAPEMRQLALMQVLGFHRFTLSSSLPSFLPSFQIN